MLVTVTNLTTRTINILDAVDSRRSNGPADLLAPSLGSRTDPLPHPFDQVGTLDESGGSAPAIQRAMHIGDFRRPHVYWRALGPDDEWNLLVQGGVVSFAEAAESGRVDIEEEFDLAIV